MNYKDVAEIIIRLKDEDLALRDQLIQNGELSEGYNPDMAELHNKNAKQLGELIDQIGYPTVEKVGKAASEAAWLIIQHAIGQPQFMKQCLRLLERAVSEHKANPKNLAYLTDRIASLEDQPQIYGTSFDWDHNGILNPTPFDDLQKVNQRRKLIGLNTMEEQIKIMRQQAEQEHQSPPEDMEKRKRDYNAWRRAVGWIN